MTSADCGRFTAWAAFKSSKATVDGSVPEDTSGEDGTNALRAYSQRFKNPEDSEHMIFNPVSFPLQPVDLQDKKSNMNDAEVRAKLHQELSCERRSPECCKKGQLQQDRLARSNTIAADTDGEFVHRCVQCGLPLGDVIYDVDVSRGFYVHGECMAQRVLTDMRKSEQDLQNADLSLKSSRREEFGIGWQIASVPGNIGTAAKMQCTFSPKGMCCLALVGSKTVNVHPTLEPACAVNLAYLSIALRVRRKEGREPLFSLDPLDSKNDSMQVKRFEPEWLAGSCVGDVLFQADVYLKELSFGEYEQPVIGMKSCFDHSFQEDHDIEWHAREWFIVRKADVLLSKDNVVIPHVRMGVEAWEQIEGPDGTLQDAKITRNSHPLVLYAKDFTHKFDLIAERKSVIFHLRELAKASVLAKYLVDTSIHVPEGWLEAGGVIEETLPDPKSLEVPQLWNERAYGTIRLRSGAIVQDDGGLATRTHGLYGGVSFGLDRFKVAQPARASRAMLQTPGASRAMAAPLTSRLFAPSNVRSLVSGGVEPRGVDLNLDKFDLSKATRVASEVAAPQVSKDACAAVGQAFWANVDSVDGSVFKEEDRILLADLFNRCLSDRRDDGDQFVPPDTSITYMQRIGQLMKEEQAVRSERKQLFFSKQFDAENPGPLYPSSWKNYIAIERKTSSSPGECMLHERPEYIAQPNMFEHVIQSATPVFDKSSEEGTRFRVYKVGSLEVRTFQELDGNETVGAVFSTSPSGEASMQKMTWRKFDLADAVKKVTSYVEKDPELRSGHRYYVVLETQRQKAIVTEMNAHGVIAWQEDPADLEVRNSLAKVFRSKDCGDKSIDIRDMRMSLAKVVASWQPRRSHCTGKRYAQCAYNRALAAETPSAQVVD